jgi:hypothetical protein
LTIAFPVLAVIGRCSDLEDIFARSLSGPEAGQTLCSGRYVCRGGCSAMAAYSLALQSDIRQPVQSFLHFDCMPLKHPACTPTQHLNVDLSGCQAPENSTREHGL